MTIWRARARFVWVSIWYLTMNYLPMIKLIKYHVTKRPGRSPGRRDSMSEPGNEFQLNFFLKISILKTKPFCLI